jgi:hypothetical protein
MGLLKGQNLAARRGPVSFAGIGIQAVLLGTLFAPASGLRVDCVGVIEDDLCLVLSPALGRAGGTF